MSSHYVIVRVRCSQYGPAELQKYVSAEEEPVLKCGTLSKKETEQVNESMRLTVDEEAKVSTMRNVTCSAYTDYPPEDRAQIGRYAAENGPARATRHFAVSDTTGRRLQSK